MRARVFLVLTVAVVVVACVVGLFIAGGPTKARQDRWDEARYNELMDLAQALTCGGAMERAVSILPDELTRRSLAKRCDGAWNFTSDLQDDETGAPFTYSRLSDHDFTICATFYDAARTLRMTYSIWSGAEFDPQTGCVTGTLETDG